MPSNPASSPARLFFTRWEISDPPPQPPASYTSATECWIDQGTTFTQPDGPKADLSDLFRKLQSGISLLISPARGAHRIEWLWRPGSLLRQVLEQTEIPVSVVLPQTDDQSAVDFKEFPLHERTLAALHQTVLQAGHETWPAGRNLDLHLARACIQGLKKRSGTILLVDSLQGKTLTGGMILAAAAAFSRWIRQNHAARRVGIVLPPGAGATLTNLAVLLADKVPVNLNFTAGPEAVRSAMKRAEIHSVLSAKAMREKLPDFPWPDQVHDIGALLTQIGKPRILAWRGLVSLLSADALAHWLGVPKVGGDQEAGLLFTSGSSGEPKGVVLSHRNIMANVTQVSEVLPGDRIGSLLGCLPIFHSFGFTVTLWWPLISGPQVVTVPSPLDVQAVLQNIQKHQVELLITTPTFLRGYARKASHEQLRSLRMVVTGAEKLPTRIREDFEARFHIPVCEGYGMTETSPVISVNLPFVPRLQADTTDSGKKDGSVGRILNGIDLRITNPEGSSALSIHQTGLLWFRGPNVFSGYLHDAARTRAVLDNGWYCSGDIGRIDEEGFLHVEGRLSRFSKIAGEMVPHGTVEAALLSALEELGHPGTHAVVMGVQDEAKGEVLVALLGVQVDAALLRQALTRKGLPNLWIPKIIRQVPEIPLLASGKLDLARCQQLALQARESRE